MNAWARSLVLLAVAGHVGLSIVDAAARGGNGGGGSAGGGPGGGGGRGIYNGVGGFNPDRGSPAPIGIVVTSPEGPPRGAGNPNGGFRPPPRHIFPNVGPDEGSPASQGGSGECEGGLQLTDVDAYTDPIDGLTKISGETQHYIDRCGCNAQSCIADALDRYAEALTKVAPSLPPSLRSLPQIVASAAHRARSAPTRRAAAHVLRAAVIAIHAAVHKTISLIRAADSDALSVATRGGDLVARTLSTAATALERANTL